jgi:hypothetical protein
MSCNRSLWTSRNLRPAPFWHRVWCRECRKSLHADKIIWFAILCRKAEPVPGNVLANTLAALDLPQSLPRPLRDRFKLFIKNARKPFAIVAGLSLAGGYGWLRYIDLEPAVSVTPRIELNPNAYTDYATAASFMQYSEDVVRLADVRSRDTQPTSAAANSQSPGKVVVAAPPANISVAKAVSKQKSVSELVSANRNALGALRAGLAREYQAPERSSESYTGYLDQIRVLAKLLRLEAEAGIEKGDWSSAMNSSLDAIKFGASVQNGGGILDKSLGVACEEFGRNSAWKAVDHLSTSECRAAINKLNVIDNTRWSFGDAVRAEKRAGTLGLISFMNQPGWRWWFPLERDRSMRSFLSSLLYRKKDILTHYSRLLDDQLEQTGQSYRHPVTIGINEQKHDLAEQVLPMFDYARLRDAVNRIENGMLKISLALRMYHLENGGYPENLAKLTPKYIDQMPTDAFSLDAAQTNFGYYRRVGRYILYSVGPDGVNDYGSSLKSTAQTDPGSAFRIMDQSRGDIVGGVDKG